MIEFSPLYTPPSSRGLGRRPFKPKTGVRISVGASEKRAPSERRSSPVNPVSPPSREFESPLVLPPINDIEAFLVGLRFEKRNLLANLTVELLGGQL